MVKLRHPKEVTLNFSLKQLNPNILTEEAKSFFLTLRGLIENYGKDEKNKIAFQKGNLISHGNSENE